MLLLDIVPDVAQGCTPDTDKQLQVRCKGLWADPGYPAQRDGAARIRAMCQVVSPSAVYLYFDKCLCCKITAPGSFTAEDGMNFAPICSMAMII